LRAATGRCELVHAAAAQGAEAIKARDWSEEECGERRRRSIELGLGRYLHTGYHGPRWTPEDIALLGTLHDEEVARRTERIVGAVRQKREELGIPNPASNRWTAEAIALLGTMTDRITVPRSSDRLPIISATGTTVTHAAG